MADLQIEILGVRAKVETLRSDTGYKADANEASPEALL